MLTFFALLHLIRSGHSSAHGCLVRVGSVSSDGNTGVVYSRTGARGVASPQPWAAVHPTCSSASVASCRSISYSSPLESTIVPLACLPGDGLEIAPHLPHAVDPSPFLDESTARSPPPPRRTGTTNTKAPPHYFQKASLPSQLGAPAARPCDSTPQRSPSPLIPQRPAACTAPRCSARRLRPPSPLSPPRPRCSHLHPRPRFCRLHLRPHSSTPLL